MTTFLKNKYFLLLLLSLSVISSYAKDITPPTPNPPPGPPGLPIDGGILVLSMIAIAYGIIKKK